VVGIYVASRQDGKIPKDAKDGVEKIIQGAAGIRGRRRNRNKGMWDIETPARSKKKGGSEKEYKPDDKPMKRRNIDLRTGRSKRYKNTSFTSRGGTRAERRGVRGTQGGGYEKGVKVARPRYVMSNRGGQFGGGTKQGGKSILSRIYKNIQRGGPGGGKNHLLKFAQRKKNV